jgi:uncharacterized membrane protein
MQTPARQVSLGIILAAVAATLTVGLLQKSPCASGDWPDLKQNRLLCYSDLVPLYGTEQLKGDRLPFLDDCHATVFRPCDQYPVLTMYAMRVAAWPVDSFSGFFYANAFLLIVAGGVTAAALSRIAGARALYFALAPSLIVYAFLNWDLLAVALATAATLVFLQKRDVGAGILLGLGAATKFYPALFVLPFAWERLRTKDREGAAKVAGSAVGAWALVNLPFIVVAEHPWSEFFRLNANRGADWDSLWFIGCHRLQSGPCLDVDSINLLSVLAFLGGSALLCGLRLWRDPDTPRWLLGFPILVAFLLSNKVYSPQYSLWLLPWFALALPDWRFFLAFELSDVAVFVTRFAFFGQLDAPHGYWFSPFTIGFFEIAIVVRAAVLLACMAAFVVRAREGPRSPLREELVAA